MVESRLRYAFMPRIVGEVPAGSTKREKRLNELLEFMHVPDAPVRAKEKEKLTGSVAEQNKLRSLLAKKHKQLDGEMTEDMDKSVALLRYVTQMLNLLKKKVSEQDSNNLTRLYNDCIRGVTYMIADGYLDRSFKENEKRFLEIEPILTTCCSVCNVSSAGNNVQGILVASFATHLDLETREARIAKQADVIPLSERRRKPFKDEKEKGEGMVGEEEGIRRLKDEVEIRKRLKRTEWTREEIINHLKSWPGDMQDRTIEQMRIPEMLYRSPNGGFEFNSKEGETNSGIVLNAFRLFGVDRPSMLKEIKTYSIGFIGDGSHTYFFLADPKRNVFIFEPVGCIFEEKSASWIGVVRALDKAIKP